MAGTEDCRRRLADATAREEAYEAAKADLQIPAITSDDADKEGKRVDRCNSPGGGLLQRYGETLLGRTKPGGVVRDPSGGEERGVPGSVNARFPDLVPGWNDLLLLMACTRARPASSSAITAFFIRRRHLSLWLRGADPNRYALHPSHLTLVVP